MNLQDLVGTSTKLEFGTIAEDKDLARQIQERLINLGLLEEPADGLFGPISISALRKFQELTKSDEPGFLGSDTANNLIETRPEDLPNTKLNLGNDLASRIVKYMLAKNYKIFTEPRNYNIVYVEGMNPDGTLNDDVPNCFNDLRIVIEFSNGTPGIVGIWEGTTEPGSKYTHHPMNPKGAARIQFGQYKAWSLGSHGNGDRHEALIQICPITVCRDFNKDFTRKNDQTETGIFGVNQHWGYDYPKNNIFAASAGCLVGRTRQGHREFMALVKKDKRYLANSEYIFTTTVIPGDDLLKMFPAC